MSIEGNGSEITVDYVKSILMQEIDYETTNDEKLLAVNKEIKVKKRYLSTCWNESAKCLASSSNSSRMLETKRARK